MGNNIIDLLMYSVVLNDSRGNKNVICLCVNIAKNTR